LATRHSIPTVVAGDKEVNEPRSDGSTERFEMVSAFLNAFSDAALLLDADGIILAVNDITVERFSTSAAALIGTFAYDIPPADALHARRKWITEVVSSGAPMHAQELYEGRRFRVSLYPVATRNGSVTRVLMLKHDVTEERDVIDERQRLALLDAANDAIIIFDLDGHIKYWNKGAERQYGWKQDDVRGELIHSLLQTVFPSPLEDVTDHLFRVGRWEGELRHTTRSGVAVTVKSHWTLQYGARNVPEAILETARDITEQKHVEDKLRAASLYARSLIEASLDPLVTINADGKITDVNKATEEVTGLSREELIESDFSNYFTEPEKANAGYRQVFTDGFVRDYPLAIRHKSGRITDVLYNATLFKNELDEIQGVFAAARDITEQKHVEDKLRAASLYARSLIEASLDPLVTINADGKITDVNKATEEVTGLSREELIESDFSNYFTEPEKANAGYRQVFTDGFVRDYPLAIRHKSGRITDVLYNATLFKNELDEIQGVFAAARDITERKQVEQQLKEHAQRTSVLNDIIRVINEASDLPTLFGPALATTFERLGFAAGFIATENERGRLQVRYAHNLPWTFVESLDRVDIDTNPYIRRVHRKGELIVWDELPVDALAARYGLKGGAVVLPIFSGGVPIGEFVVYAMRPLLLKPEERNLLLTIATEFGTALSKLEAQEAVRHYADELAKYSAHLEELVEERTAQLKDAERLVGIGETAAMIGHDLRNPLQVLQYIVDLQRLRFERMSPSERSLDEWEKEQELFAKISEQVFYMDKIVGDLQDYARPIVPEREEIAIKTLIEDVIQSLPAMDGVRITMDVEGLRVEADSHLMHRVFANLLLNAVQAMPDGGTLTVSAVVEDGSVAISVRDTGTGIRTELQDKLFKPLFTSKAKGTGLGLAVVKRIVEAHDGQVTVESEVGKGSTFTVRLPATEELKRERDSSS
jgi:PAS domain S-box-containing protein